MVGSRGVAGGPSVKPSRGGGRAARTIVAYREYGNQSAVAIDRSGWYS